MSKFPGLFVSGKSIAGDDAPYDVVNPATEETIATFSDASEAQVHRAVTAAKTRFDAGTWSQASVAERQRVMRAIADTIDAHSDELAKIETANTGIVLHQARDRHVARAAYNFRFFADFIGQDSSDLYDQDPKYMTYVRRRPIGVAALIAPWNAPIALGSMKIAAAIAFGNSCVIKPSEQAPMGVVRLVELLHEAGLPNDVVNLVNGRGSGAGNALVRHDDVRMVSFTGGTATGRAIMAAAGSGLKPSTMELGGKSANIIFADADLDQALDGALMGIFSNNGQQCLAGSRILLEQSIADSFIEKFVARTQQIQIGDPMNSATEIGPLASRAHRDRVLRFVETAKAQNGEILTGGDIPKTLSKGFYINPIAVRAVSNSDTVCQEEIFGPFASFLTFKTQEEAFAIANGTPYGLVSYVWSENINRITAAQQALLSGVVWINTPMMRELRAPFGGYAASGVGAEGGKACQALYTHEQTVTIPKQKLSLPKLGER